MLKYIYYQTKIRERVSRKACFNESLSTQLSDIKMPQRKDKKKIKIDTRCLNFCPLTPIPRDFVASMTLLMLFSIYICPLRNLFQLHSVHFVGAPLKLSISNLLMFIPLLDYFYFSPPHYCFLHLPLIHTPFLLIFSEPCLTK